jgi:hypothetical protein
MLLRDSEGICLMSMERHDIVTEGTSNERKIGLVNH